MPGDTRAFERRFSTKIFEEHKEYYVVDCDSEVPNYTASSFLLHDKHHPQIPTRSLWPRTASPEIAHQDLHYNSSVPKQVNDKTILNR